MYVITPVKEFCVTGMACHVYRIWRTS